MKKSYIINASFSDEKDITIIADREVESVNINTILEDLSYILEIDHNKEIKNLSLNIKEK